MAGRLVIPKPFREALGIGRGGEVVAEHVVQRGGRSVIVIDQALPPLTDEVVDEVLRSVRRTVVPATGRRRQVGVAVNSVGSRQDATRRRD